MGIFRGVGGMGDSSSDSTIAAVTTLAVAASASATAASSSATSAGTSATNAATSASTATTKASEASTSATNAASSASSASTSASTATTQASAASTSATNAAASASAAASSASSASASASTATTKASEASTSASNAATSASTATTQASNASTSASTATTQATNAATSATSANNAKIAAEAARDAALTAYDNFDDRYLGAKTSNPTLDNDGNALLAGALYFNSTVPEMRLYTGSVWVAAYVAGGSAVTSVTATSPIAASGGTSPDISLSSGYGDTQNPYASKTANFVLAAPNGSSGVPTFRAVVAADIPTLNQSTTGSAATLTTPRAIYGNNFNGSAALTQIIASTYGGTSNGFTKFTGATTAEKTYTLPDASSTIVVQGGALGTPSSGTVTNLTGTASININGTVGATTASSGAFTTLSATGVTTVQAGTAALPAITTTGDTNTGIFFPAADTIAFAEGGAEAMRIDSSGNVGVGTSSPPTGVRLTSTAPSASGYNLFLEQNNGLDGYLLACTSAAGALTFSRRDTSGTNTSEKMRIDSSGKVGINVTPSASTTAQLQVTGGNTNATTLATAYSTATTVITPKSSSGYSLAFASGTGDLPQLQVSAAGAASGDLLIQPYGGNVGIGTSSPATKLDVSGSVTAQNYLLSVSAATFGKPSDTSIEMATSADATPRMMFRVGSLTERMRIDSSGIITSGLGGMQVISGTAVASTSGTAINFTSIPSWVKRITVQFVGVSGSGASAPTVRLGTAGGIEATGYLGSTGTGAAAVLFSTGFEFIGNLQSAARTIHGAMTLSLQNSSTNTWVGTSTTGFSDGAQVLFMGGSKSLAGVLTQLRITFVNGTDNFDAGSINILYE